MYKLPNASRELDRHAFDRFVSFITKQAVMFDIHKCDLKKPPPKAPTDPTCDQMLKKKKSDYCLCGEKAKCMFQSSESESEESAKQLLDAVFTAKFVSLLDETDNLVRVFSKFVSLINGVIQPFARKERMHLSFKGGNVFRMAFEGVIMQVPELANREAIRISWENLLSISDLDFEVYIHNAQPKLKKQVAIIVAAAMYIFRGWLSTIDIPWNAEDQSLSNEIRDILELQDNAHVTWQSDAKQSDSVVRSMDPDSSNDVCGACDTLYMPVPCVLRYRQGGKMNWLVQTTGQGNNFPISYNTTLNRLFKGKTDALLVRMKKSIHLGVDECKMMANAEVIDVTIPGNEDIKHVFMMQYPKAEWFQKLRYDEDPSHECTCPSLFSMFHDIMITLFGTNEHPWLATRYPKRLARAVWLGAMLRMTGVDKEGVIGAKRSVQEVQQELRAFIKAMGSNSNSSNVAASCGWPFQTITQLVRKDRKTLKTAEDAENSRAFVAAVVDIAARVSDTLVQNFPATFTVDLQRLGKETRLKRSHA
jgi:hypothetical protein